MTLEWIEGNSLVPYRTKCQLYGIRRTVGGKMGPVYQAFFRAATGHERYLGEMSQDLDDAKAAAQAHRDSPEMAA